MKYLLDTNICIHWLRGKYSIAERIQERGLDNCCISEITKAELLLGEELALKKGYNVPRGAIKKLTSILKVVPIGPGLEMFAKEKARLIAEGNMIEDFDLLIACSAIASGCILVSENTKHMTRINGLRVENWVVRDVD